VPLLHRSRRENEAPVSGAARSFERGLERGLDAVFSPFERLLGRLLCKVGQHDPILSPAWHDEGSPLTECKRCGAFDV